MSADRKVTSNHGGDNIGEKVDELHRRVDQLVQVATAPGAVPAPARDIPAWQVAEEQELRLKCLELAVAAHNASDTIGCVERAEAFYAFAQGGAA